MRRAYLVLLAALIAGTAALTFTVRSDRPFGEIWLLLYWGLLLGWGIAIVGFVVWLLGRREKRKAGS